MAVKINIDKSVFNDVYLKNDIPNNKNRYLLLYGGAGSGKSHYTAQHILIRMFKEKPHRFLVCRKVANTIRNSVFPLFLDVIRAWNLEKLFTVNKTDMSITCANGNQIIFVGLDDVEKLKSIQGITSIWIEEASELKPTDFRQLDLRLRGVTKHHKQIMLTFNPISETNWLKSEFFDREMGDCTILKTTYLDNKYIGDEYRSMLEDLKERDFTYYSVYALGNWGVLGNMVYSNYKIEDIPTEASSYPIVYTGLDFGFNDPSAMVRVGIKDDELYVFSEIYQTGLTNSELMKIVETKMNKKEWLVCDSAEPDRIKEFKQNGFSKVIATKKGQGSIKFGIDLIKQHKIHIHPSCVNFISEIKGYKYKEDKDGKVYDEPQDNDNHLMDALRYAMELKKNTKKVKAGKSIF